MRFLTLVLALWVAMRLADGGRMRQPVLVAAAATATASAPGRHRRRPATGRGLTTPPASPPEVAPMPAIGRAGMLGRRAGMPMPVGDRSRTAPAPHPVVVAVRPVEDRSSGPNAEVALQERGDRAVPLIVTGYQLPRGMTHRLGGGGWIVLRSGERSGVSAGQLGGAQAGVRLTLALDDVRRLAASARLSAPLAGPGAEAAVGLDWQPTAAPIHILAEERIALDGGDGGPMLGVVAGYGPAPVRRNLDVEAYGAAGGVARRGGGLFADGAVRTTRRLAGRGTLAVDAGIGAWGGAQPRLGRFDVGPTMGLTIGRGHHPLRLLVDWRQRVAGLARLGSGPALSLAHDM